jgi:hypothetical protein
MLVLRWLRVWDRLFINTTPGGASLRDWLQGRERGPVDFKHRLIDTGPTQPEPELPLQPAISRLTATGAEPSFTRSVVRRSTDAILVPRAGIEPTRPVRGPRFEGRAAIDNIPKPSHFALGTVAKPC